MRMPMGTVTVAVDRNRRVLHDLTNLFVFAHDGLQRTISLLGIPNFTGKEPRFLERLAEKEERPIGMMARIILREGLEARKALEASEPVSKGKGKR